ncbi:MAG: bifunctional diaminohydroxyphosphoribosylaminopyrimidine deaminase/5-amino-6-(5-phosphoribosylamino)uracil reductase RibD [Gammaproteobacteria bacterium]|jgi:diaminohydroxyphosphoribosylaminopyrimidine deaminase/5-amino-6-(5-phosphoribosylamino)uracil reductase|nr:bifunctional diaminohydroxyphosphoribosylaminopyrimidine deaminase/5-amino-6-(5-phosphoribosylamino)uracil reductase RibD [Gammaproteobacteria bacterium]
MKDLDFMAHAIELAKKGRRHVQPNPMVGCVIVKKNKIIGEGWHKAYGGAHAEINAIKNCKKKFGSKKASLLIKGADVYVNLEPCSIEKNTPPCTNTLIEYQIKRVICGTLDPNPSINGRGIKILKKAGIQTKIGLRKNECEELNRIFFTTQKKLRPYIILKGAQSIDGKIALKNGESNWISNSDSRKDSHHIRSRVKGILVGRETAEQDNPALTVRLSSKELGLRKNDAVPQPVKIILGSLKKSTKTKKLFAGSEKIIIGSKLPAKKIKNVEYLKYEKKDFLDRFMQDLLQRNISSILVEGGQQTLNAFIGKNLFDELVLYTAPMILGKGSKDTMSSKAPMSIKKSPRLKLIKLESFGDDIKTTYYNPNA